MDRETLDELQNTLIDTWQIREPDGLSSESALLAALTQRVRILMERDMERLVSSMYTLDVSEKAFDEAMRQGTADQCAEAVAELIWRRELEKLESRRRYIAERRGRLSIEDSD